MLVAVLVLLILLALYVWMAMPSIFKGRANFLRANRYAHRGLHGEDAAENGLKAFKRACQAGYGIELDVQFSKDKKLMVFHDDDLKRMCGDDRLVRDVESAELMNMSISARNEKIPTFDQVLDTVDGRVPLLVEIKSGPNLDELTQAVVNRLMNYNGPYVIESFNPLCLRWLKKNAPRVVRGQLVGKYSEYVVTRGVLQSFAVSRLLINCISRPDFVAYRQEMGDFLPIWIQRHIFRTPLAVWTVRDPEVYDKLRAAKEAPIFEKFHPFN